MMLTPSMIQWSVETLLIQSLVCHLSAKMAIVYLSWYLWLFFILVPNDEGSTYIDMYYMIDCIDHLLERVVL